MTDRPSKAFAVRRLALVLAGGLAGVAVGVAGVYGIATLAGNLFGGPGKDAAKDVACRPAVELAAKIAPLARGEVAAVIVAKSPLKVPNLAFQDASGKAMTLQDWRGRTVLVNLWATWCPPCREEMPSLEALEKKFGSPGFEVVTINIDTRDAEKPKAWLKEVGISGLKYYADPNAKVFQDLRSAGRALGMPTTMLIDPNGCEIGTIGGPAKWSSDDAVKLIEAALKG